MKLSKFLFAVSCASLLTSVSFAEEFGDRNRGGRELLVSGSWLDEDIEKSSEACLAEVAADLYAQVFKEAPIAAAACNTELLKVNPFAPFNTGYCDIATPANNGQVLRLSTIGRSFGNYVPLSGPGNTGYTFEILKGDSEDELDGVYLTAYGSRFSLRQVTVEEQDEFGRVTSSETTITEVEVSPYLKTQLYADIEYFVGGRNQNFISEFSMDPASFAGCFETELAKNSRD